MTKRVYLTLISGTKPETVGIDFRNLVWLLVSTSEDEARGRAVAEYLRRYPEHKISAADAYDETDNARTMLKEIDS